MSKYNERTVDKIVRLIEEDTYTVGEICDALKLSRKTFYEWKNEKPEFRKAIEAAEDRRDEALATLARKSLRKRIEGYSITETKVIYEPYASDRSQFRIKKKEMKEKHFPPDTKAIKLALDRQDKKREKEEAKNNSSQSHPIVLKFANDINREEAIDTVRTFVKNVKEGRDCDRYREGKEEDDDRNYTTVML